MEILFQDGRLLGQIDDNGKVMGVVGLVGSVDTMGIVYDAVGIKVGEVDSAGLLRSASGEIAGLVDAQGSVWQGDRLVGQAVGDEVQRAGAAILFLLQGMPTAEWETVPSETSLPAPEPYSEGAFSDPESASTQPLRIARSRRGMKPGYVLAHLLLLIPLAGAGWLLWLGGQWVAAHRPEVLWNEVTRSISSTLPAPPSPTPAPPSASSVLPEMYRKQDIAFGRKDIKGFVTPYAESWKLDDYGWYIWNRGQYQFYFQRRFSPKLPDRYRTCSMQQTITSMNTGSSTTATVRVTRVLLTDARVEGKRLRLSETIFNEDTWNWDGSNWRITHTLVHGKDRRDRNTGEEYY